MASKKEEKKEVQFAEGVSVSTKFDGDLINLGINVEKFCNENPINESGFINISLKKSKKGDYYAVQNNYKK